MVTYNIRMNNSCVINPQLYAALLQSTVTPTKYIRFIQYCPTRVFNHCLHFSIAQCLLYYTYIIILAPAPSSARIVTTMALTAHSLKLGCYIWVLLYKYEQVPWTVCNGVSFIEGIYCKVLIPVVSMVSMCIRVYIQMFFVDVLCREGVFCTVCSLSCQPSLKCSPSYDKLSLYLAAS